MMKDRFKGAGDLHFDRMFETRSEAWERVGLAVNMSQRAVRRARREAIVLVPLLIGILVVYGHRQQIFGVGPHSPWNTWIRLITVLALLALGWTLARDIGRAAGPTFFRRMDPATAGTVGFLIRLLTIVIVLIVALRIAAVDTGSLVAGSAFSAIVLGLAAQQTLGNLFAGLVLLTARPFRVGERIRQQAGALGGVHEGIVSSLGLMYTTLDRGEDRIMIPNNGVLSAVVVPLKEPDSVDVRVRLRSGVRPSQVQALLDDNISTPTRSSAVVLLEEIDGDDVVVRVQATPERAKDGAQLADEIITTLASVTDEHATTGDGRQERPGDERAGTASGDSAGPRGPAAAYPDSVGGTRGPAAARLSSDDKEEDAGDGGLDGEGRLDAADGLLGPAAAQIDADRPREPRIRRETGSRPRGRR
jgi:small conductance mechanosensitive channel